MRSETWFRWIVVTTVVCLSAGLAAPASAETILRRDGAQAERFVANPPATGTDVVLRRDGSRAEPISTPDLKSGAGLDVDPAILGAGTLAVTVLIGLGSVAVLARRRQPDGSAPEAPGATS